MPRNLNSIAAGLMRDDLAFWEFIRMDWDEEIGTLRWTTYPTAQPYDESTITLDIERTGTPQVWDGTRSWWPGSFQQGQNSDVTISDLRFGNANDEFSDLEQQRVGGVRGVPTKVYVGFFDLATPPALVDSFILYAGEMDRDEIGTVCKVSLEPFNSPLATTCPRRRFNTANGFFFLPPPDLVINFGPLVIRPAAPTPGQTGTTTPSDADPGANIGGPGSRGSVVRTSRVRGGTQVVQRGGRHTRTVGR